MMEHFIERPSGSCLHLCYYKTGPNMAEQGRRMQLAPDVYAPVLGITEDGYIMPVLNPLDDPRSSPNFALVVIKAALQKLLRLWGLDIGMETRSRASYHEYVMSRPAPQDLLEITNAWYNRTKQTTGMPAFTLHGDPTLENIMMYKNDPVWIDPCTRALPLEAEVDIGKLLQSVYGYHRITIKQINLVTHFTKDLHFNTSLAEYYLLTHLVRLWRHQPDKRDWAIQVAGVINGKNTVPLLRS